MSYSSKEQQRAWQLAIEWSWKTINKAAMSERGIQDIARLAEQGDLIAQGIMFQYTKARMTQ